MGADVRLLCVFYEFIKELFRIAAISGALISLEITRTIFLASYGHK